VVVQNIFPHKYWLATQVYFEPSSFCIGSRCANCSYLRVNDTMNAFVDDIVLESSEKKKDIVLESTEKKKMES